MSSARVNFVATAAPGATATTDAPASKRPRTDGKRPQAESARKAAQLILPHEFLSRHCVGRRMLVVLAPSNKQAEQRELEGTLVSVEDDTTMILDDVTHFVAACGAGAAPSSGAGRGVAGKCGRVIVNGRHVQLVCPIDGSGGAASEKK